MKYEYEAVSGDQSLFDLVGAKNQHGFILKMNGDAGNIITSASKLTTGWEPLAERKVKEVKLPVVGDLVRNKKGNKRVVVYVGFKVTALEDDDGYVYTATTKTFFDYYTIIDQSKQPNPVNMVEEKWIPSVGTLFYVHGSNIVYRCVEVGNSFVLGREIFSMRSNSFSSLHTEFIRA